MTDSGRAPAESKDLPRGPRSLQQRLLDMLRGNSKYLSLRRGLIVLLITALLPITILAILQGLVRMENRRAAVILQVSNNAEALADSNAAFLASTSLLLKSAALNPLVRAGGTPCGTILGRMQSAAPAYANFALFDLEGVLQCAAIPSPRGFRVADASEWNRTLRSEQIVVSDAVWGRLSQSRIITMALPLRTTDNRPDGAIVASINLDWLDARISRQVDRATTGVAVISDSGQLVMSNRPLPRFDLATPPGRIGRVRDAQGVQWSYTVVPLVRTRPDQNGLHVVYAAPEPPRFGLLWWQTIVDFALPVMAILLASLAIWIGAQHLVLRWLLALQRLALNFAGGDYRHRPVSFAEAPREIRGVAASLYRMSSAVAERDRRLRDSLEHQRLLAREVHHRVKNNFQIVMSLLSLQQARLEDEQARQAIDQARRRISALALVHRLLYDAGELANISSQGLLGALCEQLQPAQQPGRELDLNCDFDDVPLDIDRAVPLTLWLVETVNNAFHHGLTPHRSGAVWATFRVSNGTALLTVTDDGIGIDPATALSEQPGGQSLRLIKALASQLGGVARVEPGPLGGTVAELRFPLAAAGVAAQPADPLPTPRIAAGAGR